jgi:hypothetical protein
MKVCTSPEGRTEQNSRLLVIERHLLHHIPVSETKERKLQSRKMDEACLLKRTISKSVVNVTTKLDVTVSDGSPKEFLPGKRTSPSDQGELVGDSQVLIS